MSIILKYADRMFDIVAKPFDIFYFNHSSYGRSQRERARKSGAVRTDFYVGGNKVGQVGRLPRIKR